MLFCRIRKESTAHTAHPIRNKQKYDRLDPSLECLMNPLEVWGERVNPMFIQQESNEPPPSIDPTDYSTSLLWQDTCRTDEPTLGQVTSVVISLNLTADLVGPFAQCTSRPCLRKQWHLQIMFQHQYGLLTGMSDTLAVKGCWDTSEVTATEKWNKKNYVVLYTTKKIELHAKKYNSFNHFYHFSYTCQ